MAEFLRDSEYCNLELSPNGIVRDYHELYLMTVGLEDHDKLWDVDYLKKLDELTWAAKQRVAMLRIQLMLAGLRVGHDGDFRKDTKNGNQETVDESMETADD